MPNIQYIEKKFKQSSLDTIAQANQIIEDYLDQGLNLTLRQLYYRFVASGLIPNNQREYNRLGSIINDGRLAGLIDWEAIEDRGRNLNVYAHYLDPADRIESAAQTYNIDKWVGQEYRVEVWVEKQALEGIVEEACDPLDVACFACKGYTSQSEMWRASIRFQRYYHNEQLPVIIHLGDHDPSGIDMTRDIRDRLSMFRMQMEVNRIALNMDQVKEYDPPPNPAKLTDSRVQGYIAKFGSNSWELDALEPSVLHELIQSTIRKYLDADLFNKRLRKQEKERKLLLKVSKDWDKLTSKKKRIK